MSAYKEITAMMTSDSIIYLSKQLLWNVILISSPIILTTFLCGLVISIVQVVTQIQDSILSTVPKMLVVIVMFMLCGGWMLHHMMDFSRHIIQHIPEVVG